MKMFKRKVEEIICLDSQKRQCVQGAEWGISFSTNHPNGFVVYDNIYRMGKGYKSDEVDYLVSQMEIESADQFTDKTKDFLHAQFRYILEGKQSTIKIIEVEPRLSSIRLRVDLLHEEDDSVDYEIREELEGFVYINILAPQSSMVALNLLSEEKNPTYLYVCVGMAYGGETGMIRISHDPRPGYYDSEIDLIWKDKKNGILMATTYSSTEL